jgi:hypothetical protein
MPNNQGFTLIEVLILTMIVVISALGTYSAISVMRIGEIRVDRGKLAKAILADTIQQFAFLSSDAAWDLCGEIAAKKCDLSVPSVIPSPVPRLPLGLRRSWTGDPLALGGVCVELTACKEISTGLVTEFEFNAFWQLPSSPLPVSHSFGVRRSRW